MVSRQILLISGPSGSGKSSLLSKLFAEFKDKLYFSISSTTRAARQGEKDGVNYHFISQEQFQADIKAGLFLEWANVHGNLYGTSLRPVTHALNEGKVVVFDIDVQGYLLAKKQYPKEITAVFISTQNSSILASRLENRGSESDESIKTRLENAKNEMKYIKDYDHIIVNDDLEAAYESLRAIFISMHSKCANFEIEKFCQNWNN